MDDESGLPNSSEPGEQSSVGAQSSLNGFRKTVFLGIVSALLFGSGVFLTELIPEVGTDIDFKPFFIVYLLIGMLPFGIPTLSVALGGALGEGFLDVFEGYELDDPFGFLGYFFGFFIFGWYLDQVASDPTSTRALTIAALLGAFVQALFEGIAFAIFQPTSFPGGVVLSILGNTITHGLVLGAIPLLVLYPYFSNFEFFSQRGESR